ncbi:hypothetical protein CcCBS67573_g08227 [Chytriomyces confervae]|uniref:Homeobox domain-containing protein n=1 Tax=Chytriomyces confervae TaxID=246404 RepID=A0A507EPF9_9FUNG|nr:hypothetical protein CcCBS67573_g08227 [Chytriomyces confervae]
MPQVQLSDTPPAALQTNSNNNNNNTLSRDQQHPHQLSLLAGVSAAFHSSSSSSSSSDMPSPPSSALGMQPPPATACRPSHYAHAHDADTCMLRHSAPTIPSSSSAATLRHPYQHHQYQYQQHMYMPAAAGTAGIMPPLSSYQAPSLNAHLLQNEIHVAPSQARSQARFSEQQFQQHYPTLQQQHHQHHHAQLPSSTVAAAVAAAGALGPSYEQQRVDHHHQQHQQQQQSSTGVMQQRFITPPTSGSIRATKAQLKVLEKIFLENAMPSGMMHQAISERIGMSKKAVRNWFQNQRAKVRRQEQEDRYLRGQHSPIPDSQYQHQGGGGGPSLKYHHSMHYSQAPAVPHQQQQQYQHQQQGSPYENSTVHSNHLAAPMSGQYHHPHAQHQTQQLAPLSPPAGGPLRPLQWVLDQHEQQPKQEHFEKRSQQQQQYSNEPPAAQCIETEEGLGISMESSQKVRRNVMSVEALV